MCLFVPFPIGLCVNLCQFCPKKDKMSSEQELDGDDSMPQILLAQDEGGESWDAFNLWFLGRKRNDFGEGQGAVMGPEQ